MPTCTVPHMKRLICLTAATWAILVPAAIAKPIPLDLPSDGDGVVWHCSAVTDSGPALFQAIVPDGEGFTSVPLVQTAQRWAGKAEIRRYEVQVGDETVAVRYRANRRSGRLKARQIGSPSVFVTWTVRCAD